MRKILLVAALLLTETAATAARPPVPLSPTGPWNVDFADSMCVLSRPYAEGKTNLVIKPGMIGDSLEVMVMTPTTSVKDMREGKAVMSIGGKATEDASFNAYSTAKMRLVRIRLEGEKFPLSAVNGDFSITAAGEGRWTFTVTHMARALPTLNACLSQLRAAFNVSDAELAPIVTYPEGRPVSFFKTEDYPDDAVRSGHMGTVGVLIWVEASGSVSTCTIIEASAATSLQNATCDVLKRRGRFTPAKDAAQKAVRAPIFTRVRWLLPD